MNNSEIIALIIRIFKYFSNGVRKQVPPISESGVPSCVTFLEIRRLSSIALVRAGGARRLEDSCDRRQPAANQSALNLNLEISRQ